MSKHINDGSPDQILEIFKALTEARKSKGLTQEELGQWFGAPQSHVSRLEAGKVDIRASNLVELARLVDLEVMLIPRKFVPAVGKLIEEKETRSPFLYRLDK